jgi:RHS repeat-associated protein
MKKYKFLLLVLVAWTTGTHLYAYDNPYVPDSVTIDKTNAVGEIPFASGVSASGAMTYNVPIEIYPGIHGFQPQFAFTYNSQIGLTPVGIGWTVSGLSSIYRVEKNIFYDGKPSGVLLDKNDALMLDNIRLIKLSDTSTQIKYQSEQGNIKVTAYLSGDIIQYFQVFYPNGSIGIFGYTNNSSQNIEYPITILTDCFGNTINYTYALNTNHYRITNVTYNNLKASVEFGYEYRWGDEKFRYVGGLLVADYYDLSHVLCKYDNKILRTYDLINRYGHDQLAQIHLTADGVKLNPLKFYYKERGSYSHPAGYDEEKIQISQYHTFTNKDSLRVVTGKFMSDTNDALIMFPNKNHYYSNNKSITNEYTGNEDIIFYAGSDGQTTSVPILKTEQGFVNIFCANINGMQEDAIIKVNNIVANDSDQIILKVYSRGSNGQILSLERTKTLNLPLLSRMDNGTVRKDIRPKEYIIGDFMGNGKAEMLIVTYNSLWGIGSSSSRFYLIDLNTGIKLYEGFNPFVHYMEVPDNGAINTNNSDRLFAFDYDGDGKTDICTINSQCTYIYSFDIFESSVSLLPVTRYMALNKEEVKNRQILIGEFVYDKKSDIMLSPKNYAGNKWTIYYSTGYGKDDTSNKQFEKREYTLTTVSPTDRLFLHDIDFDGRSDLIRCTSSKCYTYLTNILSPSSIRELDVELNSIIVPINIHSVNYSHQTLLTLKNNKISLFSYDYNFIRDNALAGVVNSLGVIAKIEYKMLNENSSSNFYQIDNSNHYPFVNGRYPLNVVRKMETYLNGKKIEDFSLSYKNAFIHKQGLGFRGFEQITTTDSIRNRSLTRIYDPFNFGVLKSEESPVAKNTYTYSVNVATNKIAKINITGSTSYDKLKNITVTSSYVYDTYGNPTSESINYGSGITETISKSYYNNTNESGYMLGFLRDMTKTTNRNGTSFIERNYIPLYEKGLPKIRVHVIEDEESEEEIEESEEVTVRAARAAEEEAFGNLVSYETFAYNTKGNLTQHGIKSYSSSTTLTTAYEYDNYGRLTKETDPLGLYTEYEYNSTTGSLYKTKNHKQQATTYGYDAFERNTSVSYPDDVQESTAYTWTAGGTNGLYCVESSATGKPSSKVYYDALGRETRSSITQFNGTQAHTDKLYDSYGCLEKVSLPFTGTSASSWNTYNYDTYDRPTSLVEASGKTTSWSYSGNSVTTTKEGIASTQTFDAQGNVINVSDPAGTITYNLRPDGQPSSIVAPVNVSTSFEYDNYGRQTAIVDPSAGRKTFAYDSAGNLQTQTDANGKTITMNYDQYNRLTTKVSPEFTTRYRYNADNQLVTADSIDTNLFKSYTYDTYGRLWTEKEKATSNTWLQKKYGYTNGNVSSMEYSTPAGVITTENYTYDNGYRTEIRLNGTTSIWKLNSVNTFGQPTNATTGSFTREYGYNDYGLPTTRKAGSFQNFSYIFAPETGNLTSRKDVKYNKLESFTYDNLNRLLTYKEGSVVYDSQGKGNITKKSDTGNSFAYNISGKPYAISGVTSPSNAIPSRSQTITYTSFDRPATISENGDNAAFTYNGSGDRMKMILGNSTNAQNITSLTRYYLSDCYESDSLKARKVVVINGKMGFQETVETNEKLYLGGDYYSAPAVFVKENSGNWNIYYICRDYLGSITHITTSSGSVVEELSYDAWGRLRNPSTLAVYAPGSEPELFLGRGYTGHEHLPPFGLINMNARLYDPAVGRFLSPDPFVQFPSFSQSFNRYSYALNNPFKYTDPDGENPIAWILAGLIMGGKMYHDGYKANGNEWNPAKWDWQNANYTLGYSSQGNGNIYGGVGWNNDYSLGMGYGLGSGSLMGGYLQNGAPYMGSFNQTYTDPAQKADQAIENARQVNKAGDAWVFFTGLSASAASELYFSKNFGTWMGKNFRIYDQSWGGNGSTGGKNKYGKSTSNAFRVATYGIGAWNAYSINQQKVNGEIDDTQWILEEASNAYSTLGGIYGAAWSVGWETGRYTTQQSWYQRGKFQFFYYKWQLQYGVPSYENRYRWEYFFNNYKP